MTCTVRLRVITTHCCGDQRTYKRQEGGVNAPRRSRPRAGCNRERRSQRGGRRAGTLSDVSEHTEKAASVAQTRRWPGLSGGSAAACQTPSSEGRTTLTERLLLEDKENRVNELDIFDVVVDHVEGDEALRDPSAWSRADQWNESGSKGLSEVAASKGDSTYRGESGGVADGPVEAVLEVKRDTKKTISARVLLNFKPLVRLEGRGAESRHAGQQNEIKAHR
jgi:hypothetical protein